MKLGNFFGHLRNILVHKYWVFKFSCKLGIPWRGLVHDLSKFSFIEFSESVKFYTDGKTSPINTAKEKQGYSLAWQHHKGRNPHHYEYWIDNIDNGGIPLDIPKKYKLELLADYLAAGKTYMGKYFTYKDELNFIQEKFKANPPKMHERVKKFILLALTTLSDCNCGSKEDFKYVRTKLC